jgi:hypothetical protein
MKKISLIIFYFVYTTSIFSQTTKEVNAIDKAVNELKSKRHTFQKIEKINSDIGSKYVFLNNKDVKFITVKSIETTIEKNVEWYYINGQLAYCETNWLDVKTKTILHHEKQYLKNGHLIEWIDSNTSSVSPSSPEFKKLDTALVAYGIKLKNKALN